MQQPLAERADRGGRRGREITRVFVGPQLVKSVSDSLVALRRDPVLTVADESKAFTSRRGTTVTRTEAVKNEERQLRAHRGGVTALLGQSGSGKSTLA